jgi:hypothetical protein
MDTSKEEQKQPGAIAEISASAPASDDRKFFPGGAIAFFILLVALSLLFWYGIYFLMIERT